jgi:hypothetical protein
LALIRAIRGQILSLLFFAFLAVKRLFVWKFHRCDDMPHSAPQLAKRQFESQNKLLPP